MNGINEACRLKTGSLTLTTLQILNLDIERIESSLQSICQQNPDFFQQTPILIGLPLGIEVIDMDWQALINLCRQHGLEPIAVRADLVWQKTIENSPLAFLPVNQTMSKKLSSEQKEDNSSTITSSRRLIIDKPVRSGQQIYHPGKDLIIQAPVSQGAEVLSDGDLHIYGPLRGRALAGIKGDRQARIYCDSFEAELVSIAGCYTTSDNIASQHWKNSVCITLNNQALTIEIY